MDIVHWTILQDETNPRLGVSRHQSDTIKRIWFDSSNGSTMSSFSMSQVNTSGHLICLYARRYTCLYIKRVGMFMFTKCLLNSLQKMEFLSERSKILNWFVWIFLIEFCKELKRKFVNQSNVLLYHQDGNSLRVAKMVTT